MAWLRTAGANVLLTEYSDARHGSDNPLNLPLLDIPRAQSTRNCRLEEGPGGRTVDADTG